MPPDIDASTREERRAFVIDQWKCLHSCELCGKCHILRGAGEDVLFDEYINGKRPYADILMEIRRR